MVAGSKKNNYSQEGTTGIPPMYVQVVVVVSSKGLSSIQG